MTSTHPQRSTRGAVGKGCILSLVGLLIILFIAYRFTVGTYNTIVSNDELVEQRWSEVGSQYKRRFDLVPQLVETVKGAADFEASTLQAVTEARASVGRMQLPEGAPTDPAQLQEYLKAQSSLGGALSRLLVVAEQYPTLKATQNFLSLQDQLEGTENRINVARIDYISAVKTYNTSVRTFPGVFVAGFGGFEERPQLDFEEGTTEAPVIDFGGDK